MEVLINAGQCKSKGEARRLIDGGGVSVNDTKILRFDEPISADAVDKGEFVLHKGKKVHLRVVFTR